jgi:adenylate cyclase
VTDLLGDGVNIAARLEGIAEPGGVCVSGAAYDYVRKTLPLTFTDLGPQQVKNIEEPIRAYAIATIGPKQPAGANDPASTNFYALPDKPSLVVLPFTSLSSGAEHEAFIEGMVEDITAALAQAVDITVASRPSTLTLKSKAPDAREVARDLGVRYLVQGSVRRSGSRIRVSAQLTDGISGLQLWSGRYDRVFDDLFIVQDEITQEVASLWKSNSRKVSKPPSGASRPPVPKPGTSTCEEVFTYAPPIFPSRVPSWRKPSVLTHSSRVPGLDWDRAISLKLALPGRAMLL